MGRLELGTRRQSLVTRIGRDGETRSVPGASELIDGRLHDEHVAEGIAQLRGLPAGTSELIVHPAPLSLNRHMLPPYGNDWLHAPNFERLAQRSTTFDNYYVGSMPCIPARRDLHTGRYNFLHRSWGPIEPFDDSMPQILKENDVYTHLATDHHHYFEDGGCTYHHRYNTWFFARGQEGDAALVVEDVAVDAEPGTQPVAAVIVPRDTAGMDFRPRCLADDQQP